MPTEQSSRGDAAVMPFGPRVVEAVTTFGPLCAGIDPSSDLLGAWDLPDDASGLRQFGSRCLEAFAGTVGIVKPQVAFFERHGAAGFAALEALLVDARQLGLVVIADAKRGDIDSTSVAYADAWLGASSPLRADAVTVTPYMGVGALRPMIDNAVTGGRGVFIVVRSSNPEGRVIQQATTAGGSSVEDMLLSEVADLNRAESGVRRAAGDGPASSEVGSIGVVVGATLTPSSFDLADLGGVVLAPGVGAQGAGPADLARLFGRCRVGTVLANVSRSVLSRGPDVARLRVAAAEVRDAVSAAIT